MQRTPPITSQIILGQSLCRPPTHSLTGRAPAAPHTTCLAPPPAIAHTVSSMGLSSASCSPATTSTCMAMRRHAFQLASPPQSTCAPLRTPAHSGSETHSVSTRNHPGQPVCAPLLKISSYRQRQRASVHHATAARAHTSQQLAHGLSPSAMCMSDLICCPRRLRQPAHTPCMRCQYVTTRSVSRWVVPSACFVA